MNKTILITGGAGYIGSHIAYCLAQRGNRVIIVDTLIYDQTFDYPWATFIKGDCGDEQLLRRIFQCFPIDAVIHCAASIEVGESVKNPLAFYVNNVATTIILLKIMHEFGIRQIIFSSSCAVFGIPQSLPLNELHPFVPVSPYGRTKLMVENILQDMCMAYGFGAVVLRFFNAAGALPEEGLGERHNPETHIIPLVLRAAYEQRPFYIFGANRPTTDGTCIRDFVHVLDIAHAHVLALEYLEQLFVFDTFNLGTGTGYSVKEIVNSVETICGKSVPVIMADDRPGDPPILVADANKACTILGWRPQKSDLETIIRSACMFSYGKLVQQTNLKEKKSINYDD